MSLTSSTMAVGGGVCSGLDDVLLLLSGVVVGVGVVVITSEDGTAYGADSCDGASG